MNWEKTIEELPKHIKRPEENVEYTFIFPGQKFITYTYCGLNEKGRLILYNVKQKTFSTMTPGWFSALCGKRKQLVRTRRLDNAPKENKPVVLAKEKEETYEERTLRQLRTLSAAQALTVEACIGYTADKLADELEAILNDTTDEKYSSAYVGRVFTNLMHAQSVLSGNKQQNNLGL